MIGSTKRTKIEFTRPPPPTKAVGSRRFPPTTVSHHRHIVSGRRRCSCSSWPVVVGQWKQERSSAPPNDEHNTSRAYMWGSWARSFARSYGTYGATIAAGGAMFWCGSALWDYPLELQTLVVSEASQRSLPASLTTKRNTTIHCISVGRKRSGEYVSCNKMSLCVCTILFGLCWISLVRLLVERI